MERNNKDDYSSRMNKNNLQVTVDALDGYFRREAANDPQPELHIRPNKRASYDIVARVLAAAQRNGLLKIGFVGNEQFM